MIKVHILDRCEFCDGEAYIFDYQDVDSRGDKYDRYQVCEMCHGSGNRVNWINQQDFSELLDRVTSIEPDYADLSKERPINHYQDSRDAVGI